MKYFLIPFSWLLFSQSAYSSIQLRSIYYNMDTPILTEYISNSSDKNPIFVKAEVYKLEFDSVKNKFIETDLKDERELMLTPNRFIVQPKKTIPFKIIGRMSEKFEIYRVRFRSISSNDIKNYFDESELKGESSPSTTAGAEVLLSYGTIVYKNPTTKIFDTKITNKSNVVEVSNHGNSAILLTNIKTCKNAKESSCAMKTEYFVSPNQSTSIPGYKVSFNVVEDGKITPFN